MDKKSVAKFRRTVWNFYKKNKRNFPWRETTNPYYILVSEIMLQQTQADRVVPYYETFIRTFPNFASLADATFQSIYNVWQGLGYNRRALSLKKIAEQVTKKYQGTLPEDLELLPGIGPYTASAISIFSFNTPIACIETNIRRVFIHHFFSKKEKTNDLEILKIAEKTLDVENPREWHWALMDYGAYLKKTTVNPNRRHSHYRIQSKFEGSLRQIRGAILRNLAKEKMNMLQLNKAIKQKPKRIKLMINTLVAEGLIKENLKKKTYSL